MITTYALLNDVIGKIQYHFPIFSYFFNKGGVVNVIVFKQVKVDSKYHRYQTVKYH